MTPTPPMAADERRWMLRYTRVDQWSLPARFPLAPSTVDAVLADILQTSPAGVRDLAADLDRERDALAVRLVQDGSARADLERLAARDDLRIAALGDSITVDRLSWFDIIAAAVEKVPGDGRPLFRNLAVSGATTADLLERFDLVHAVRPTHLLVMAGTNDARRHGHQAAEEMVTLGETRRNLGALMDLCATELGCWTRLITPPAVDGPRVAAAFSGQPVGWRGPDIDGVAATVLELDPRAIDVHSHLPVRARVDLLEADGIHPSATGQLEIARLVLSHLARA